VASNDHAVAAGQGAQLDRHHQAQRGAAA
jgi:hypothetical protein